MAVATSLIPGLDEIIKHGDPDRRAEAARRITELYFEEAATLRSDHVDLFDGALINLVPATETASRVELAERLAVIANAPRGLVGQLAREDEILIAGPLLRRSPVIDEGALIDIAQIKGQGHLLAMSERPALSPGVTDVIVRRGDRDVVRRAAGNAGALFSPTGYSVLITRASQDGVLTLKVGQRDDLSDQQLKDLLAGSIDIIRRRLFEVVKPARQAAIKQAMSEISGVPEPVESRRDFAPALRTILALRSAGELNEAALLGFAKAFKYEESIAALAAMSGVRIGTLDRLIRGERYDPILIVGKVVGLEWATVRALILLRLGAHRVPSPTDIESARVNFARLMPSTAQRVVNFWQTRQSA
jgi:uncharacterized protein (DUF2336 family)